MQSIRLALRGLLRTPFVTAVAVLSLALGIGANAAIFSLFEQFLLRPLPVAEPDRLVNLTAPGPKQGSITCNDAGDCDAVFSYPMFRDLENAEIGFAGIAAHRVFDINVAYRGETLNGDGMLVSGSYFSLLGLRSALGRLIEPADDETLGGHPVAVLSHSFWQSRLGGDPDVLNQTILINGNSLTVIGVAPRGFEGTTFGARPLVFVPITMGERLWSRFDRFDNRRAHWAYLFARLEPGVSVERATAAVNAVFRPIVNDVEAPLQRGMSDQTMAQFRAREIRVEPGRRGQSEVHGRIRVPMILLLTTTGIVLLIACANIANLLLVRGAGRSSEMAIRLALGANRRRVLAQLLTESLVLAALGGVASLFVAHWTLWVIGFILPPESAAAVQLELRMPVVLFAAAMSIGTGVLFGMFPALHSTRPEIVSAIRANAGNILGARPVLRFRSMLVTAQIALSLALLITAGLFLKSLLNVARVDLGLNVDNVVTFRVSPQLNGYAPERSRVLFARIEEELQALPGVTNVTAATVPLLASSNAGSNVSVQGFEHGADIDDDAVYNKIGPAYFRTLAIPLLAGREFTASDALGSLEVAIVNEAFAEKFNLGGEAVGKWMAVGGTDSLDILIVGLAQNAKYSEVKENVPALFFTPYRQDEDVGIMNFYVRTSLDPRQVLRAVPGVIARIDANLPVEDLKTLPQQIRENTFLDHMITMLSAAFAALATLLATVGLYGVLAYTVAQRTREIGVRMALGADAARVRRMVLRQVTRVFLIGGAIGVGGALGLGRAARSLLFGLDGNDPIVITLAVAVLAMFALGAGYIPALRASHVDPMRALRYE